MFSFSSLHSSGEVFKNTEEFLLNQIWDLCACARVWQFIAYSKLVFWLFFGIARELLFLFLNVHENRCILWAGNYANILATMQAWGVRNPGKLAMFLIFPALFLSIPDQNSGPAGGSRACSLPASLTTGLSHSSPGQQAGFWLATVSLQIKILPSKDKDLSPLMIFFLNISCFWNDSQRQGSNLFL